MKIFIKVLSIALVASIPVTVFSLGANIVTRMPDVYQYEFKATDALKHFEVDKNNDEMGEFISDFMTGREKIFQLMAGDEDRPQVVFTESEMTVVAKARLFMNVIAVIGCIALIITVTGFVMLKKNELDAELRNRIRTSVFVYMGMLAVYLVGFFLAAKMGHSLMDMLGYVPVEEDMLPKLLTEGLETKLYISTAVVSTVCMIIIGYGVHKLTAPKRIFSRGY